MPDVETVMCRACGHFVRATETDGGLSPIVSECPECGGDDFKRVSDT